MRRLKATLHAISFFFRVLGVDDYDDTQIDVGQALYMSGVIFDLWMGRFDR